MFPPTTDRRTTKRSLRELLRGAVDTALEFATLGEASALAGRVPVAPSAPMFGEHPHRRQVGRPARVRRPGMVAPRAQVCLTPVHRPARRRA